MDGLFMGLAVLFFALCWGLIELADRISGS